METATKNKVKITMDSVIDQVIGGALLSLGVVGASYSMRLAKAKLNPYLVSALAMALGIVGRVASNYASDKAVKEGIQDISNGFVSAGALDLGVKLLTQFGLLDKLPAEVQAAVPKLSGPADQGAIASAHQRQGWRMLNGLGNTPSAWKMLN